ncbi:MAG TPA: zf-HC2 domain-containing protein [Polyangium sp.]|nr:zf-HC2 domain-containing protein [Polyangium sp.]
MSLVVQTHPTCKEIVELITSYLEGALTSDERDRFEMHLGTCGACVTYHEQMLATRMAAAALRSEPSSDEPTPRLLAVFREWKEGR